MVNCAQERQRPPGSKSRTQPMAQALFSRIRLCPARESHVLNATTITMNVQGASEAFLDPSNIASPLAGLTSFPSTFSSAATTLAALPGTLWRLYVDYLWNYDANSWVAHAAYSMRVMAVLLMLPITVLTMLVSERIWSVYGREKGMGQKDGMEEDGGRAISSLKMFATCSLRLVHSVKLVHNGRI